MRLLYYANGARYKVNGEWVFRKWFTVPSKELIQGVGVPRKSMYKIRDELVKANYIRFKPGIGSGVTEYTLCPLNGAQKPTSKPTEACRSLPKPTQQETPVLRSFNLDDFWDLAVKASFGEEE